MKTLNVSISPHIRTSKSTTSIMLDVIIALLPSIGVGIYVFGWRALMVTAISVASCVLTEFVYEKLMKLPVTVGDLSAVVTGLILAACLYSTAPWWIPVIGGVFAILIVKMLFGGIGQNFMNPALAARCFLLLSFAGIMTDYPNLDAVTTATPLAVVNAGNNVDLTLLLFGNRTGTIGEASAVAILIGALYLIIRRVISVKTPLIVVGSAIAFIALFTLIKGETDVTLNYILAHLLGGGLLIGAVFMASDYATTPVTFWGQVIFCAVVGLITAILRVYGASAEGISFAIIISNLLTPMMEKITYPRPFGIRKEKKHE